VNKLYRAVLREAIKRLDQHCDSPVGKHGDILMVMDEHEQRLELVNEAARVMVNSGSPRDRIIEPSFQVERHRFQTLRAADWIAGLVGRIAAKCRVSTGKICRSSPSWQKPYHSRSHQWNHLSSMPAVKMKIAVSGNQQS
jgi:hypothetical protein